MKTIIIDKETQQIVELRDYNRWNYGKVEDIYDEIEYDYDLVLGETPIYYIDGKLTVKEEPIPSTLNAVTI